MFRFQKISKILILLVVISGIISCGKDDRTPKDFMVIGDVFIAKRLINDEVNYSHVYFAYGNKQISSATVTPPEGESIQLSPVDAQEYTFGLQPKRDDFSPEFPGTGIFDFTVVNDGIEYPATDNLEFDNLEIPEITSAEFNLNSQVLTVEWNNVSDADSYHVKITSIEDDIIFVGQLLNEEATAYEIDLNSGSWIEFPEDGIIYNVEVHAFSFEPDADNTDYMYNIQENSIGTKDIVWGE